MRHVRRGTSRALIVAVAVGCVSLFALASLLWFLRTGCEDATPSELRRVRCGGSAADSWVAVQQVLFAVAAVALLAGIVWALRKATLGSLAGAAVLGAGCFAAIFVIDSKQLADKPIPRLSAVRVLDRRCVEPCAAGVRVAFTLDRPARMVFSLQPESNDSIELRPYRKAGYGYRTGVVKPNGAAPDEESDFAAGRHLERIRGVVSIDVPRVRTEALPPGLWVLSVTAHVQQAGHQVKTAGGAFSEHVRILRKPA